MKEILRSEYGISNEKEFNAAVSKMAGINLGIFTMPLAERSVAADEQKKEMAIA
ncbi:MAG: hypothetical protein ACLVLD_11705 [Hungatella sp.]